MTLIDTRPRAAEPTLWPDRRPHRNGYGRQRPTPARPAPGAVAYRGTGVAMSRAPHEPRPVSAAVTAALAGMAALITVWLGSLAQSGGVTGTPAAVPDQLAVVRVQSGETLQHLAARVAPDAPVGQVVARIRELNHLDSAALDAGQTLIAPMGRSPDAR
jgi:LysM domain-containing protein